MKIMYFTFANKVNVNNFGLIYFKYWYWFSNKQEVLSSNIFKNEKASVLFAKDSLQ